MKKGVIHSFLVEAGKILATLDKIVEGQRFNWGYHAW